MKGPFLFGGWRVRSVDDGEVVDNRGAGAPGPRRSAPVCWKSPFLGPSPRRHQDRKGESFILFSLRNLLFIIPLCFALILAIFEI